MGNFHFLFLCFFCFFLVQKFVEQSRIFVWEEEKKCMIFSKMMTIKKLLVKNKRKCQEQGIQQMYFDDLWAVGLFTSSTPLCSQFQSDLRKSNSGCKWNQMVGAFYSGLQCLQFVQKMGVVIFLRQLYPI